MVSSYKRVKPKLSEHTVTLQEHTSVRHQRNRVSQLGLHKVKLLLILLKYRWLQLCIGPCTSPATSIWLHPLYRSFPQDLGWCCSPHSAPCPERARLPPSSSPSSEEAGEHFGSISAASTPGWALLLRPTSWWGRSSEQTDTPNSLHFRNPLTYCQGQQRNPSRYFDTDVLKHSGFIAYH